MEIEQYEKSIKDHLAIIKKYVKENLNLYPTHLPSTDCDAINCYICPKGNDLLGLEILTGYCFKDNNALGEDKGIFNGLKLYDIMVHPRNILISVAYSKWIATLSTIQNCQIGKSTISESEENQVGKDHKFVITINNKHFEVNVSDEEWEDAILSIVTHEFMHSLSKGFCTENDCTRDEVYTNYYAKEIFCKIYKDKKFYDAYAYYPKYSEEKKGIKETGETRSLYFRGIECEEKK